uniref:type II toxin-antitoxin system RelE/ParE family toxin n=1 Tax=Flavobacterium sp. TaxID=239 RepID=UPI00404A2786
MKLVFSNIAQIEYDEIIFYLNDRFGKEKAVQFSEILQQRLKQVKQFPESFGYYYETNYRKLMVNPYITVINNYDKTLGRVEILNFWFNRANPDVILKHL